MNVALLLFAFGALLIGFIPPGLLFGLRPDTGDRIGQRKVPIPAWVFIGVWVIIYPCFGVAAWQVLHGGATPNIAAALLVLLAAGFAQTMSFWLTDSLRTTAILDGIGVLAAATTLVVLILVIPEAAPWLVPWAIWMPITLAVKIAVLRRTSRTDDADPGRSNRAQASHRTGGVR